MHRHHNSNAYAGLIPVFAPESDLIQIPQYAANGKPSECAKFTNRHRIRSVSAPATPISDDNWPTIDRHSRRHRTGSQRRGLGLIVMDFDRTPESVLK